MYLWKAAKTQHWWGLQVLGKMLKQIWHGFAFAGPRGARKFVIGFATIVITGGARKFVKVCDLWPHWWRRCSRSLPMVMTSLRWYPRNVKTFFWKNSQKVIWQICVICQNRSNNKKVMTVLILSYNVNQWRNKWRHLTGLPIFAGHLFIFLKCVTY